MTSKRCARISASSAAGSGQSVGLPLQVPDAAVPAQRLAVRREEDERVARDPLLPERSRQAAELVGVVEVPGGLQETERPSGRQRRPAEQLRHLAHEPAQVRRDEEVPGEAARRRRVVNAHAVVRAADGDRGVGRAVEEERPAAARHEQRDADVGARPVAEMRVPELARLAEPVQPAAALAQAVEVLLARERETGTDPRAARAGALDRGAAVGGLAQQPLAGGAGEGQPHGVGCHLDSQVAGGDAGRLAAGEVKRCRRPRPPAHERSLGGRARPDGHADDARGADREYGRRRARKVNARITTLETEMVGRHGAQYRRRAPHATPGSHPDVASFLSRSLGQDERDRQREEHAHGHVERAPAAGAPQEALRPGAEG